MEKRFIAAIALSLLILLAYRAFITKMYPVAQQEVASIEQSGPATKTPTGAAKPIINTERNSAPPTQESPEELFTKETDNLILTFSNIGGRLKEVVIKAYKKKLLERDFVIVEGYENLPFVLTRKDKLVIYSYQDQSRQIVKSFNVFDNSYSIDVEITTRNLSSKIEESSLRIYNGSLDLEQYSPKELHARDRTFLEFSIANPEKVLRWNFSQAAKKATNFTDRFEWVGIRDRYFCSIFYPLSSVAQAFVQPIGRQRVVSGIKTANFILAPGENYSFNARLFIGPQDTQILASFKRGLENIVSFGTFDIISQGLLSIMRFLFSFIHSWGACILLICLLIFLVLYPLTAKSLASMKKMQALQPQIEKLRSVYKDQPQKLNKEIMGLYRENKINPFSGCLPMVLQIPIFFALYQALMRSIELKGTSFLWIKDLSEPDRLFILQNPLPVIGADINLLPLIMIAAMFLQQKLSTKSSGSTTIQEQQKIMMIVFPLMFGFLFYNFPSGLTLYWVSYTILSIFSQSRINRMAER